MNSSSKVAAHQYQRAVTPTIDLNSLNNNNTNTIRGKVLSYNPVNNVNSNGTQQQSSLYIGNSTRRGSSGYVTANNTNIRGSIFQNNTSNSSIITNSTKNNIHDDNSLTNTNATVNNNSNNSNSNSSITFNLATRQDLIPCQDEIPADGIIFARIRNQPKSLVVFRTPEERMRNPERLNLDRRQLEVCPILEQEQRLRLLNYQNNAIRVIENIENLPNLIFLDFYSNKITSLEGPLQKVRGLRVLMAGKNKIQQISNLNTLRKLDVLDLHSNEIKVVQGLEGLADLRVLNLAGNRICSIERAQLFGLTSLMELNLRRNFLTGVDGLESLPALQRLFLSHNQIKALPQIACVFSIEHLIELSLDGNPLIEESRLSVPLRLAFPDHEQPLSALSQPAGAADYVETPSLSLPYRSFMLRQLPQLKHLDLKKISDEERSAAVKEVLQLYQQLQLQPPSNTSSDSEKLNNNPPRGTSTSELTVAEESTEYSSKQAQLQLNGNFNVEDGNLNNDVGLHSNARMTASSSSPMLKNMFHTAASAGPQEEDHATAGAGSRKASVLNVDGNMSNSGLAALARAGRLPKSKSLLDIEILSGDERALIAVADSWEWSGNHRRLLPTVTELLLLHMRREQILSKFNSTSILSSLQNLKSIRILSADFQQLRQLESLVSLFGALPSLEQLSVKDCPIASSAPAVLRDYLLLSFPRLHICNDVAVSSSERQRAEKRLSTLLQLTTRNKSAKQYAHRQRASNFNSNFNSSSNNESRQFAVARSVKLTEANLFRAFNENFDDAIREIISMTVSEFDRNFNFNLSSNNHIP